MSEIQLESTSAPAEHPHKNRRIRSFVLRQGHLSKGQERAVLEGMPLHGVTYHASLLDPSVVFGRTAPLVLEIGFGMGGATATIAKNQPEVNFLGVEVHTPGVGSLLQLISEQALSNLKIIQHDAVDVLNHMIAPMSLDGVHIFFPDPWHKARHHKRRLIQPALVDLLASRIKSGGYIHLATDWENYAEQMLSVLSACPSLQNTSAHVHGYADKPDYRPLTKFEQRGLNLGHGVWDLVFKKR